MSASGTSLSTPLVASAVALLVQARPDWTVAQIRIALTGSAADYVENGTCDPDEIRGFGIIDTHAASQMRLGGGDYDNDGDVDYTDYSACQAALTSP